MYLRWFAIMESVAFEQTRAELPDNEGCFSEEASHLCELSHTVLWYILTQASADVYEVALDKV